MLWVSEHGQITRGASTQNLSDGNLQLSDEDFDCVLSLLDNSSRSEFDPVFRYSRSNGRDVLTVQQYVGLIRTDTECQFEILPKIAKKDNAETCRELLVKMLIELKDSLFKEGTIANLHAHPMPLFEFLIRLFLSHVGDIVKKGIARTYVSRQDNLVFLRGKLQITEHIRRNAFDHSHLCCEFDEYEIDRPINRLIKSALKIVFQLTKDDFNQQRCREFLYWFDRVPSTEDHKKDFRAIRRDRLIQHYQPAMPTCRLILERLNPLTQPRDRRAHSVLFNMHQVFENYVSVKLNTQLRDWDVESQVRGQALVEEHSEERLFELVPDLRLSRGSERVIGDIKWKLLNQKKQKTYGIPMSDIYQLFAYSSKYLGAQQQRRSILIYPKTATFESPLSPFWFEKDEEVFYVLPYDLAKDELIMDKDFFLVDQSSSRDLNSAT